MVGGWGHYRISPKATEKWGKVKVKAEIVRRGGGGGGVIGVLKLSPSLPYNNLIVYDLK